MALGISSWLLGTSLMTSIPGLIVAKVELNNIKSGKMDASQSGICKVGFWLNIANVVFTVLMIVLSLLFFVGFFGLAFLSR